MKVRLNKRTIDEAVYEGPGGCYLWDTQQPGFGVRIYPTGAKSFVVSYWINGRRRFYTIGRYGRITLPQARKSAMEVFLQVHRGADPSGDRRAAHQAPTVADLADRHISDHVKIKNHDHAEVRPPGFEAGPEAWKTGQLAGEIAEVLCSRKRSTPPRSGPAPGGLEPLPAHLAPQPRAGNDLIE